MISSPKPALWTSSPTQNRSSHQNLQLETFARDTLFPLTLNRVWTLEQGFVRSFNCSEEGDVITLGIWGVGDIVGQPLAQNAMYQLECLTPVRARRIELEMVNLAEVRALQVQQMETLLNILHCRPLPQRLLMLLEWLAEKYGQVSDRGCLLDMRLTHRAIAEIIGTTRVTVTRLLNEFENQGKLEKLSHQQILLT